MKKFTLILTFLSIFGITGCGPEILISPLVAPIIQGALMWKDGLATKYYSADSTSMYYAAKRTATELGYPIFKDDPPKDGNYYFVCGENNKFKVSIDRIEDNVTLISIRIDFMGDRKYAELFYEKLDEQTSVIEFGPEGLPRH